MKLLPRTSFGSPLNMNALSPFNVGLDVRSLFFDRAAVSKRARAVRGKAVPRRAASRRVADGRAVALRRAAPRRIAIAGENQ